MPMSSGRPICTGAPCTAGKRVVIWMARMASAGLKGPHRHHHRSRERAGGRAGDIGAIHRHGGAALDMANRRARPRSAPPRRNASSRARRRRDRRATISKCPAARRSARRPSRRGSGEYRCGCRAPRQATASFGIADLGDADQRAGLRVALAEVQEIVGEIGRKDGEIALHEARREARCRPIERARAAREAHALRGLARSCSQG